MKTGKENVLPPWKFRQLPKKNMETEIQLHGRSVFVSVQLRASEKEGNREKFGFFRQTTEKMAILFSTAEPLQVMTLERL